MQISEENKVLARFIKKTLEEKGKYFLVDQTARICKVTKKKSGRLLNSRRINVYGGNGDFDALMTFEHPVYERFLDMRALSNQDTVHKREIHNRMIYQMYGKVANRLMNGFTKQVQEDLREEIDAIKRSFLSYGR